ncbi:plasmid mobilization protein [Campylobacter hyointestinalis]|uniref:plasmid mobilization protein n=1 Tax=Campylobacter hyointestinalis TaxID=198 RepID=UPI0015E205D2
MGKISAKINELGGITFSKYAINSMLSRPITKTPITKELILELSRQGNNLNQIASKLNQGKSLDKIGLTLSTNRLKL